MSCCCIKRAIEIHLRTLAIEEAELAIIIIIVIVVVAVINKSSIMCSQREIASCWRGCRDESKIHPFQIYQPYHRRNETTQ